MNSLMIFAQLMKYSHWRNDLKLRECFKMDIRITKLRQRLEQVRQPSPGSSVA